MPGKVIVQTYNPDNFAIECSKKQNFDMFYETEIELRKQLKYPPFCDIISIGLADTDEIKIKNVSEKLYKYINSYIEKENLGILIYKPLPCPIDKIKNRFRWRIILKGKLNKKIIDVINLSIANVNSKTTRIIVDTNPTSLN